MKTTIETLTTARQIAKEGKTYIEDINATVERIGNENNFGWKFYARKHDYISEHRRFKTFKGLWNYLYLKV